ncbi:unnamed protein product [Amoebophrya sp. A25]|nr:unnamed protein product [Amoebophrya sp. A25]|eukprot:GSA25T00010482001.1
MLSSCGVGDAPAKRFHVGHQLELRSRGLSVPVVGLVGARGSALQPPAPITIPRVAPVVLRTSAGRTTAKNPAECFPVKGSSKTAAAIPFCTAGTTTGRDNNHNINNFDVMPVGKVGNADNIKGSDATVDAAYQQLVAESEELLGLLAHAAREHTHSSLAMPGAGNYGAAGGVLARSRAARARRLRQRNDQEVQQGNHAEQRDINARENAFEESATAKNKRVNIISSPVPAMGAEGLFPPEKLHELLQHLSEQVLAQGANHVQADARSFLSILNEGVHRLGRKVESEREELERELARLSPSEVEKLKEQPLGLLGEASGATPNEGTSTTTRVAFLQDERPQEFFEALLFLEDYQRKHSDRTLPSFGFALQSVKAARQGEEGQQDMEGEKRGRGRGDKIRSAFEEGQAAASPSSVSKEEKGSALQMSMSSSMKKKKAGLQTVTGGASATRGVQHLQTDDASKKILAQGKILNKDFRREVADRVIGRLSSPSAGQKIAPVRESPAAGVSPLSEETIVQYQDDGATEADGPPAALSSAGQQLPQNKNDESFSTDRASIDRAGSLRNKLQIKSGEMKKNGDPDPEPVKQVQMKEAHVSSGVLYGHTSFAPGARTQSPQRVQDVVKERRSRRQSQKRQSKGVSSCEPANPVLDIDMLSRLDREAALGTSALGTSALGTSALGTASLEPSRSHLLAEAAVEDDEVKELGTTERAEARSVHMEEKLPPQAADMEIEHEIEEPTARQLAQMEFLRQQHEHLRDDHVALDKKAVRSSSLGSNTNLAHASDVRDAMRKSANIFFPLDDLHADIDRKVRQMRDCDIEHPTPMQLSAMGRLRVSHDNLLQSGTSTGLGLFTSASSSPTTSRNGDQRSPGIEEVQELRGSGMERPPAPAPRVSTAVDGVRGRRSVARREGSAMSSETTNQGGGNTTIISSVQGFAIEEPTKGEMEQMNQLSAEYSQFLDTKTKQP